MKLVLKLSLKKKHKLETHFLICILMLIGVILQKYHKIRRSLKTLMTIGFPFLNLIILEAIVEIQHGTTHKVMAVLVKMIV